MCSFLLIKAEDQVKWSAQDGGGGAEGLKDQQEDKEGCA